VHDDPATTQPPHADRPVYDDAGPDRGQNVRRLPVADGGRDPRICPFLSAIDAGDRLDAPVDTPDQANRCVALRDPVAQSLRQQELVCLTSGHVNCPRYLRGAVVVSDVPVAAVQSGPTIRPAVLASILVLVAAFTASVAFVVARGGITLPPAAVVATASPAASSTALAVASPAASAISSVAPSAAVVASATPAPTATPLPTPTPTPLPTATATPAPTPEPTAKPTKQPTSDRYALLKPCPDKPKCWIYTVRSGDNLFSIANYFGVPLGTVKRLNPWTETTRLKAGQHLILPPPTR
jgi:LysM repeat protein